MALLRWSYRIGFLIAAIAGIIFLLTAYTWSRMSDAERQSRNQSQSS